MSQVAEAAMTDGVNIRAALGVVEEQCVWNLSPLFTAGNPLMITSCGNEIRDNPKFEFCPFCGKEIAMYSLYRVHYINNLNKKPVVVYEYGEDESDVLLKVLRDKNLISEVKVKKIADKASLLDAAVEILNENKD